MQSILTTTVPRGKPSHSTFSSNLRGCDESLDPKKPNMMRVGAIVTQEVGM
jgi:hypothetical protein